MRIAYIANTPDSREAGIAKIMNSLADAIRMRGHSVDLIFSKDVPVIGPRRLKDFLFGWLLILRLKKNWNQHGRHDVVAIHSMSAMPYVWLRTFMKQLPPCVVVSYGSDEMRWNLEQEEEKLGFKKVRLISKLFYGPLIIGAARYATRHADHVMVAAKSEIDFYESRYQIKRERVTFIPNGVAPAYFADHDYKRPANHLLFFGGWEWRKGIRYLVEAFEKLTVKYPDLKLTIAGIGPAEKEAFSVFSPQAQSKINIIACVREPETPRLYADHDIFIFPSLFESMSLVVPEAMAAGLPVITTRTCGMQDIIENEKNGFLVPPRSAEDLCRHVESLIRNSELRQRIGLEAQRSAKRLLWSEVGDSAIALYRKVLDGNHSL